MFITFYLLFVFQMKSTRFLVILYVFVALGGIDKNDSQQLQSFLPNRKLLKNRDIDSLVNAVETQQQSNHSNIFLAAERGTFPNCQIYGRTYCIDIEGYPE